MRGPALSSVPAAVESARLTLCAPRRWRAHGLSPETRHTLASLGIAAPRAEVLNGRCFQVGTAVQAAVRKVCVCWGGWSPWRGCGKGKGPLSKTPRVGTSAAWPLSDCYLRPLPRPLRPKQRALLPVFVVKREPSPAPVSLVTQALPLPPQRRASSSGLCRPGGGQGKNWRKGFCCLTLQPRAC